MPSLSTAIFKDTIEELKVMLSKRAEKQDKKFSVIGIANGNSVQKGWNFLNSSGNFDEAIIGKSWLNSGCIVVYLDSRKSRTSNYSGNSF